MTIYNDFIVISAFRILILLLISENSFMKAPYRQNKPKV